MHAFLILRASESEVLIFPTPWVSQVFQERKGPVDTGACIHYLDTGGPQAIF